MRMRTSAVMQAAALIIQECLQQPIHSPSLSGCVLNYSPCMTSGGLFFFFYYFLGRPKPYLCLQDREGLEGGDGSRSANDRVKSLAVSGDEEEPSNRWLCNPLLRCYCESSFSPLRWQIIADWIQSVADWLKLRVATDRFKVSYLIRQRRLTREMISYFYSAAWVCTQECVCVDEITNT